MRWILFVLIAFSLGCATAEINCKPDGGYSVKMEPGARNMRITGSCDLAVAPPPPPTLARSDTPSVPVGVKNQEEVGQLTPATVTTLQAAEGRKFEIVAGPVSETAEEGFSNWWSGLFGFLGGLLTSGVLL